jgi:Type I restriction modification DNA specificity domain
MRKEAKVKEISEIRQAGFAFRGRIEAVSDGQYQVLQIKDIGQNNEILSDSLIRANANVRPIHLVKKDDVLFASRGANRRAAFVENEMPNTIFIAQIFALRGLDQIINPAYLAWFINQKPAQDYLEFNSSGSHIQNITIEVFENLPVIIPPLETQRKIVEIHHLWLREKELVKQISEKRSQVIEKVLLSAIGE